MAREILAQTVLLFLGFREGYETALGMEWGVRDSFYIRLPLYSAVGTRLREHRAGF